MHRSSRSALRSALLLSLAIASGCSSTASKPPESKVNLAGFPPAFRDGYNDGCSSAKALIGTRKDEKRCAQDRQYAAGWRDGYDMCKKKG